MSRNLLRTFVLSGIALFIGAALALAGTMTGRVEAVDAKAGTLTLITEGSGAVNLTAPSKLLYDVEPGSMVEVDVEGGLTKAIHGINDPEDKYNLENADPGSDSGNASSGGGAVRRK